MEEEFRSKPGDLDEERALIAQAQAGTAPTFMAIAEARAGIADCRAAIHAAGKIEARNRNPIIGQAKRD